MIEAAAIAVALWGPVDVARAQSPDPTPVALQAGEVPGVAPRAVSSTAEPFGVMFQPRYTDLQQAPAQRDRDVTAFQAALPGLDASARASARDAIDARLSAVRHWEARIGALTTTPGVDPQQLRRAADLKELLDLEAGTLELQLALLGAPAATLRPPRVAIASDVVVQPGERFRNLVVVGGDAVVRGHIDEDVVVVWGDVAVEEPGEVTGRVVVVGGEARGGRRERGVGANMPAPPVASAFGLLPALLGRVVTFLSVAGASTLLVGLFPDRVHRVAREIDARPGRAFVAGFLGAFALLALSALLTVTVIGIPVALMLLTALGVGWVMGLTGVSQAVGDKLPLRRPLGRWVALAATAALVAVAGWLPWPVQLAVIAGSGLGLGASLTARFGQA